MIERLKSEHVMFEAKLVQVEENIKRDDIKRAAQIIQSISGRITRHAVEEEARLMRVIMHNAKDQSSESIKIMQEHNWVMSFLKNRVVTIKNASALLNSEEYERAKEDLNEFVSNLRKHFKEEEQIVFPLTLRVEGTD
jgi:hemerythrin-like domain-containing protein